MINDSIFGVLRPDGPPHPSPGLSVAPAAAPGFAYRGRCDVGADGLVVLVSAGTRLVSPGEIAQRYRAGPAGFPGELRGSFAVAVMDPVRRSLTLAVDRMGIETLSYAGLPDGGLVFGSSSEAVAAWPGVDDAISMQAVYDFFFFHMVPGPHTIYAGVSKLRPAHMLSWAGEAGRAHRYWSPAFASGRARMDALEADLKSTLQDAVRRSQDGEGAGAFLSGGVDSSTVAGFMAREAAQPVPVFSVGFESAEEYDELRYARIAGDWFGLQRYEYDVTPGDIVEAIPRIAAAYDEPFGNSSAVPTLKCAELARSHGVAVLLAGDGGDELFGGNPHYARQKLFEPYARLPSFLRAALEDRRFLGLCRGPFAKLGSYIEQARIPMPDRNWSWNYIYREARDAVFAPGFLEQIDQSHPLSLMRETWQETGEDVPLVDRMLYLDWQFILADADLRKVGRMCDLAGVDVRYPMLDDELVALSLRVPASRKVRGMRLRHFYKQAMSDFLPPETIRKEKHGFGLPFGAWLKEHRALQDAVYARLESFSRRGVLNSGFVPRLIEEHRHGHASYHGYVIWDILMLEAWLAHRRLSL